MLDSTKKKWDKTYRSRKMVYGVNFAEKAYKYLQEKTQCSILDIGCGDGRDAAFFAERGLIVTAIDFSEEAIRRVHLNKPFINALNMDILDMKFPDASFNSIYAHLSLHYFDDETTKAVMQNIFRMLKPTGFFFIRCKSTDDSLYGKGQKIGKDMFCFEHIRHFFSKEYMREKLYEFKILSLEETSSSYDEKQSSFIDAVAQKI